MKQLIDADPGTIPSVWAEILNDVQARAVREERRRFSNDLHDIVSNHLNVATILLASARRFLPEGDVKELIKEADRSLRDCWNDARRCAVGIRPLGLERAGLVRVLTDYASEVKAVSGIPVTFIAIGKQPQLSEEVEITLLRVAQEAVTNALRHGHPMSINIELRFGEDAVGLQVSDDGGGFDLSQTTAGVGLLSMRDRSRHLGGELAILSRPGRGTRVILTISSSTCTHEESDQYVG
jgi:signal transduction histidine kinase